jgi:hypothetical protein
MTKLEELEVAYGVAKAAADAADAAYKAARDAYEAELMMVTRGELE